MKADLHTHTTFSDGILTPEELVDCAVAAGVSILGITDHDTIGGVGYAKKQAAIYGGKIRIISGVEISTKLSDRYVDKASVHILGYFVDETSDLLASKLCELQKIRLRRFALMKAKLETLGYKVILTESEAALQSIGRPHLARALVRGGYFETVRDAFDKLLAKDRPAYVSLTTLSQEEAVQLIHSVGGLAFLAHPVEVSSYEAVADLLQKVKFDGIELTHPSMMWCDDRTRWYDLAIKYSLRVSGGSDFHGTVGRFPKKMGEFFVDDNDIDTIFLK